METSMARDAEKIGDEIDFIIKGPITNDEVDKVFDKVPGVGQPRVIAKMFTPENTAILNRAFVTGDFSDVDGDLLKLILEQRVKASLVKDNT